MGRSLLSCVCVCALGFLPLVGCSDNNGGGGSGGTGGSTGNVFPCTEQGIRDAIAEGGGPHRFACDGPTTVVTPTPITIDNDVILDAEANLVVERGPWSQVGMQAGSDFLPVFRVDADVTAELCGFYVSGGGTYGMGVANGGALTLCNSTVFGSDGIGIVNSGTLVVKSSAISENRAPRSGDVVDVVGVENTGTLTLMDSTVSDNEGAGISNTGTLTLMGSTVSGNQGAGIPNRGMLTLTGSTVSGNQGAGIPNTGTLTLMDSTVSDNQGAGIPNSGTLTLVNSTVSNNQGVGITSGGPNPWVKNSLSLTSSTLSGNADGAISIGMGATVEIALSIIDGGCSTTEDQRGITWTSNGYNIESPGDTCRLEEDTDQVNLRARDLALDPLTDNGGPTYTQALERLSVAIDVIPEGRCGVDEDQRGVARPQGDACDVGAFEWKPEPRGEECAPSEAECASSEIDAISESCEIIVPDQASTCDGTESTENPSSCTASGNTVTHKLTKMQVVANCNAGYDLDGCNGNSCALAGLAPGEGANGIDNALGSLGPLLVGVGVNLALFDWAFHQEICAGGIDIEIEVDAVPAEGCAVVTVSAAGAPGAPVPMNLSDDGCLSGAVGTIPITVAGVEVAIDNAIVRMTVSPLGFSNGILGGTMDGNAAGEMFDQLVDGGAAIMSQVLEIAGDLYADSLSSCNALSMTLEIGGDAIP